LNTSSTIAGGVLTQGSVIVDLMSLPTNWGLNEFRLKTLSNAPKLNGKMKGLSMKTDTVENLMKGKSKEDAIQFLFSARGNYIMGQALYTAIEKMNSAPAKKKETSNIMDMIYIMNTLFPMYKELANYQKSMKENKNESC
jgi:hypothetical protein